MPSGSMTRAVEFVDGKHVAAPAYTARPPDEA
jgi:hypothetical protein